MNVKDPKNDQIHGLLLQISWYLEQENKYTITKLLAQDITVFLRFSIKIEKN